MHRSPPADGCPRGNVLIPLRHVILCRVHREGLAENISIRSLWADAFTVIRRGWRALVIAQVVFKIVAVMLLAPMGVAVLNAMLGETASIGNVAIARFALSPVGIIAIVLLPTIVLAELLIEQSLMIALVHDACERPAPRITDSLALVLWRVPRLVGLALLQVLIALAIVVPFLGLAGLVYWLMLSGADINFYLANLPPVFIAAVTIGAALALTAALLLLLFYIHVFLTVPIVLFEDVSARAAIRESAKLSKGRRHEVAWAAIAWLAIRIVVVTIGLLLLRRSIGWILLHCGGG